MQLSDVNNRKSTIINLPQFHRSFYSKNHARFVPIAYTIFDACRICPKWEISSKGPLSLQQPFDVRRIERPFPFKTTHCALIIIQKDICVCVCVIFRSNVPCLFRLVALLLYNFYFSFSLSLTHALSFSFILLLFCWFHAPNNAPLQIIIQGKVHTHLQFCFNEQYM